VRLSDLLVEIRNRAWLDKRLTALFREHKIALAFTNHSYVARPWNVTDGLDLVTTDFVYVRWLGDRKGKGRSRRHGTSR
jgi:hypothetical protein